MSKGKLSDSFEKIAFSIFHTFNLLITITLTAVYFRAPSIDFSQKDMIIIFSLFFIFLFLALDLMVFINYDIGLFFYISVLFAIFIILDIMNIMNEDMATMFHLIPVSLGIIFIKKHYKLFLTISLFIVITISYSLKYMLLGKIIIVVLLILFLYSLVIIRKWLKDMEESQKKNMKKINFITLKILGRVSEIKDTDTSLHLTRVEMIIEILADAIQKDKKFSKYLTDSYIEDLKAAAYLHDIGKIGITDTILLKPGILTGQEFSIMKTHTLLGYELLKDAMKEIDNESLYDLALVIARNHHEKWDGTGYPDNLKGEEIPFSARIMSIVDVYDALISKRPYKMPYSHKKAIEIMKRDSGSHFDPDLVRHFLKVSDIIEEKMKDYIE